MDNAGYTPDIHCQQTATDTNTDTDPGNLQGSRASAPTIEKNADSDSLKSTSDVQTPAVPTVTSSISVSVPTPHVKIIPVDLSCAKIQVEPCKEEKAEFRGKAFPQLLAAFACHVGAFAYGTVICYSAVAFPKLRTDYESFGGKPTEFHISWLSAIITLGALTVCIPAGIAVDRFGRRTTMLLLTLPFIAGWLLIYFAPNFAVMMTGRFITGFSGGAFSVAAPIFLAETSEARIRGMIISGYDLMACFGVVFILTIGTFLSWRNQALVCAFVPIIFHAILFFVPESPRYLLSKGREEEAEKNLCWFRGVDHKKSAHLVKPEFYTLLENVEQNKKEASGLAAKWEELKSRPVLKAVLMSFLLFFFQVFSGICAVDLYSVDIFQSAGSSYDEYISSIIIGAVGAVAAVGSASVVDRFGRRILLMTSEVIMTASLVSLGTFFYLKEKDSVWALEHLAWLPLTALMFFIAGFTIGLGPIPFSFMPEVLPQRVRGLVSSLLLVTKSMMTFTIARFFKDFMELTGEAIGYWIFALICFAGFLFVIFILPETKGKTLEEIQREMTGKSGKSSSS